MALGRLRQRRHPSLQPFDPHRVNEMRGYLPPYLQQRFRFLWFH